MFWPMAFQYIKQSFINVSTLSPWPNMTEKPFYWKYRQDPNLLPEVGAVVMRNRTGMGDHYGRVGTSK